MIVFASIVFVIMSLISFSVRKYADWVQAVSLKPKYVEQIEKLKQLFPDVSIVNPVPSWYIRSHRIWVLGLFFGIAIITQTWIVTPLGFAVGWYVTSVVTDMSITYREWKRFDN